MEIRHEVYRCFDAGGQLLYVGLTDQLAQRVKQHAVSKPWWSDVVTITVERFASRGDAIVAEATAIANENPAMNDTKPPRWLTERLVRARGSIVPVSEAKARLAEIVREAEEHDVTLLRHGRPAAYVVGVENYEALVSRLEDAEDKLSIFEREHVTMDYEKLAAELGFTD